MGEGLLRSPRRFAARRPACPGQVGDAGPMGTRPPCTWAPKGRRATGPQPSLPGATLPARVRPFQTEMTVIAIMTVNSDNWPKLAFSEDRPFPAAGPVRTRPRCVFGPRLGPGASPAGARSGCRPGGGRKASGPLEHCGGRRGPSGPEAAGGGERASERRGAEGVEKGRRSRGLGAGRWRRGWRREAAGPRPRGSRRSLRSARARRG